MTGVCAGVVTDTDALSDAVLPSADAQVIVKDVSDEMAADDSLPLAALSPDHTPAGFELAEQETAF
jgi:hypothetical protein